MIEGSKAQFVLTTRNAEGEQCYDERDCITVEIGNSQAERTVRQKPESKLTKTAARKLDILPKKPENAMY